MLVFWTITAGSFASAAAGRWPGSTVAKSPHRAEAFWPREAAAQPGSVLPNGPGYYTVRVFYHTW